MRQTSPVCRSVWGPGISDQEDDLETCCMLTIPGPRVIRNFVTLTAKTAVVALAVVLEYHGKSGSGNDLRCQK